MPRPLGQHFLFDPSILERIVSFSGVSDQDTVVEIGPGLGTLTKFLARAAKRVICIELDRRLIERLRENLRELNNVEIIHDDALRFDYGFVGERFKVVSNIPYSISTPLIFKLLEYRGRIISMTLLLQKELARRIIAGPGSKEYGLLSIMVRLYSEPEIGFYVSKGAFSPPPEVDSACVHFRMYERPPYKIKDPSLFREVVKTAFSQRRKMIANSLRQFPDIHQALERAGINPRSRPEELSIEDFIKLTESLSQNQ